MLWGPNSRHRAARSRRKIMTPAPPQLQSCGDPQWSSPQVWRQERMMPWEERDRWQKSESGGIRVVCPQGHAITEVAATS